MQTLNDRLDAYARITRLHRPIGILLLLWPTLWALWLAAGGRPPLDVLAVFVAGVVLMRSAGCVLNDLADRKFDGHVTRTRERPLVTGEVRPREALILAVVLIVVAGQLVLLMNALTVLLSLAAVAFAASYPFFKRFTYLPQFYLGLAFSWSVPMGFAAVTGTVPTAAWLVLVTNLVWVVVYDTEYAMVDRTDDLRVGIRSTAILFGDLDRLIIGLLQVTFLVALLLVGEQARLGPGGWVGIIGAAALFVRQQVLIATREPDRCFRAFNENHWVGLTVFVGILLGQATAPSG